MYVQSGIIIFILKVFLSLVYRRVYAMPDTMPAVLTEKKTENDPSDEKVPTKTCVVCAQVKPVTGFYKTHRHVKTGEIKYRKICKKCVCKQILAKKNSTGRRGKICKLDKDPVFKQRVQDALTNRGDKTFKYIAKMLDIDPLTLRTYRARLGM